jgi:hypothetical protein
MKKVFAVLVLVLIAAFAASAQTKDEANFMALEKQAWDAFGKGDGKFFETFLVDEAMIVGDFGASSKAQTVKDVNTKACELKSYEFSNFKVIMLDKNTALATYEATQDATCGGQKSPGKVFGSTVYVKRKGKWMGMFHQESAVQPMPAK